MAWAQYGPPEELPNIHHRQEYEAGLGRPPDYRITCIFVDRRYRRHGVAALALRGALDLIAKAGGGVVEGYPHDMSKQPEGKKMSSSFLYNGTRKMYEAGHLRAVQGAEELRDDSHDRVRLTALLARVSRRSTRSCVFSPRERLRNSAAGGLIQHLSRKPLVARDALGQGSLTAQQQGARPGNPDAASGGPVRFEPSHQR